MNRPKIVVIGSSNTDMVIKLDRLPAPGETLLGGDFIMAAGGKGANQAVAAARLGAEVTFIARVGSDMFGQQSIANFQKEGINTDFIVIDERTPSGVALIFVDKKAENSIAVASGANNNLSIDDVIAAKPAIDQADVLLLQLEIPMQTVKFAAKLAHNSGVKVVLNPAPAHKLDEELLSVVSVLTPNESEIELLTSVRVEDEASAQKAANILMERGVSTVIITLGSKGSILIKNNKLLQIPTKKINAIDTTAAGDAFNGALAYAMANKNSMEEAVKFANHVGALSATRMGAQPSMPTYDELIKFMEN